MPSTLQPALAEHPFLRGMTPEALALLTGCAKNHRFAAGEYLATHGTQADRCFLIRKGRVALYAASAAKSVIVNTAGPGELVGWSWIITPYRYRFDARATEDTLAFDLDGACLRQKCDDNPALGYEFLKRVSIELGRRLDDVQLRLLDVYGEPDGG
ncbi:MAG: cyclic nucleotide-binding domain-containing protein [Myxococcales bacterium]|nr:cyclic nucleotide-binding domain-containing protein [Myxococcales bacterium]MDD9967358.1 cyclic nucleotide-binding domain-containing protein [Myxococcales bacterium]